MADDGQLEEVRAEPIPSVKPAEVEFISVNTEKEEEEYRETIKFNNWLKAFLDKDNPVTYGNATQSALATYNTTDPNTAGNIGSKNLRKSKALASTYAESRGLGFGKMIEIAASNMISQKSTEWWDRLMRIFGYLDSHGNPLFDVKTNDTNWEAIQRITASYTLEKKNE